MSPKRVCTFIKSFFVLEITCFLLGQVSCFLYRSLAFKYLACEAIAQHDQGLDYRLMTERSFPSMPSMCSLTALRVMSQGPGFYTGFAVDSRIRKIYTEVPTLNSALSFPPRASGGVTLRTGPEGSRVLPCGRAGQGWLVWTLSALFRFPVPSWSPPLPRIPTSCHICWHRYRDI